MRTALALRAQAVSLLITLLCLTTPLHAAGTCAQPTFQHFNELLERGRKQLLLIEYIDARVQLEEAVACLGRLDRPVPGASLGRLFMDLGVARLNLGDERGATEAFRRASVMGSAARWEPRLGTRGMAPYLTVKEDVLLSPRRHIQLPTLAAGAAAALDGEVVTGSRELSVLSGGHLLQVREAESEPWIGLFIDIPDDESIPPLPNELVGKVFRTNVILVVDPVLNAKAQLSPGPGRTVKRATVGASALALATGAAALAFALTTRSAVLDGDFDSLEEGEALRQRSNAALGAGLGLSGAGIALAGAGVTLYFGFPAAKPGRGGAR